MRSSISLSESFCDHSTAEETDETDIPSKTNPQEFMPSKEAMEETNGIIPIFINAITAPGQPSLADG